MNDKNGRKQLEVYVAHLDCENEAAVIKRGLRDTPGLFDLRVYPKAAKVTLEYNPATLSPESVRDKLKSMGFPPQQRGAAAAPRPWRNPKVILSASSGVLLLLGWLVGLAGAPRSASFGLYLAAIIIGGYYFGREAGEDLIFERTIGIELLMSVAAVVATVMGQAAEGATLVFLYSISEAAEGYTEEKTRSAVKALMKLAPKTALVRRNRQEAMIPVEELVIDDIFLVKPGQAIPTDGIVEGGASSVNQAPITGESAPIEKQPGAGVFAGTINGEGVLEIRAIKTFADNTIARIIHMVEEAQEKKGKNQRFIERFGARYSPLVLLAGIVVAIAPPLAFHAPWVTWITRATVFLVAAAPCALVISIPITLVASLGTGARQGVLFKGGLYVEELAKIEVVALDKTGTITTGKPAVTDVCLLPGGGERPQSERELLALAAAVEQYSEHPLARAVVTYASAHNIDRLPASAFRALPGSGAVAEVNGSIVHVGSPQSFRERILEAGRFEDQFSKLQSAGKTVLVVGNESAAWGIIAVRDQVRPNTRAAVTALYSLGIRKVIMITGDNERTANTIAREVGIDEVYAALKPEEKAAKVRDLAARYGHVAMVGDGVNDAPALAEATVGVAMGAAGTDVALETADVALMADDLGRLVYALELARRNHRVVKQNLALSAVVITALVIGAVAGVFTLPIAVLGHEISEFIVIGSGLRMLRA
jgi:heavy metal translocating P-type ATPase